MILFTERPNFKYKPEHIKLWVTTVWDGMKPFTFSNLKLRREMLTLLIEKMIAHLNNPLLTSDFLMDSMDTRMFLFFLHIMQFTDHYFFF